MGILVTVFDKFQKLAEKILRQKEQDRSRAAQHLQRELEEIEVRKSEVEAVAGDLEKRLRIDAENVWILEQWLLYVEEMNQLKQRENELKLQVREFEVNEEYRNLQQKLKEIQSADANTDTTNSEVNKTTCVMLEWGRDPH
ncbi:unnamed protein product [Gongylonema pulchrum]|uniref:BMERB domain-containing protein n=1 Tax=Gongylonema pulchrum TaxID=637853 RepID=A0A183EVK8_9BILA|nr:unnamed protein product [Gongylonema pulchrum]